MNLFILGLAAHWSCWSFSPELRLSLRALIMRGGGVLPARSSDEFWRGSKKVRRTGMEEEEGALLCVSLPARNVCALICHDLRGKTRQATGLTVRRMKAIAFREQTPSKVSSDFQINWKVY